MADAISSVMNRPAAGGSRRAQGTMMMDAAKDGGSALSRFSPKNLSPAPGDRSEPSKARFMNTAFVDDPRRAFIGPMDRLVF
jgi:hypothetical protein